MVEYIAEQFVAVIAWPEHEPRDPCAKLIESDASWLDVKSGDKVLSRQRSAKGRFYWVDRIVKQVTLYRVFPTSYNGRIVSSGRDWLEGTTDGEIIKK